ncbi:gfo/Idh/MocA family oxidoreductase [candidate division KSB3 bacterium]|uniref:Gfo/Idh/MocA family oxidoreductase n=1 Tax=candidate division KSB3 bacterium TaxID=2044937 RepID=A0A9D5JXE7_9BACT|nr:gfo/Idh/MocA family oxidoreductase [candidate division KSB3 bacterium]MBD3326079.1 gfo/Idh/MocA family oxidoreductase [candidate division KSB3 bacterium]
MDDSHCFYLSDTVEWNVSETTRRTMTSIAAQPIKFGFIGAGFIGQLAHIANYAQVEGCELYALAEIRPELRRKVLHRYGFQKGYANHRELLADPDVEAVVVVTPRPQTGPIALECLKTGRHVLTEKPMAHTWSQAQQLVSVAHENGVVYAVGYMKRHDEGVQMAKTLLDQAVQSGEFGQIIFARAHCFMGDSYCQCDGHITTAEEVCYPDHSAWTIAPDWLPRHLHRDFAWFLNVYGHNINLLRYLLDKTPDVTFARLNDQKGQITVFEWGHFPAILESGRFEYRGWDEITEIYFERARVRIQTPPPLLRNVPARIELYKGSGATHEILSPQSNWTWSFRRQAEAFINDIRIGSKPLASGSDSEEDLRLVEKIWRIYLHTL